MLDKVQEKDTLRNGTLRMQGRGVQQNNVERGKGMGITEGWEKQESDGRTGLR